MAEKFTDLIQTRLTKQQMKSLERMAEAEGLTVASWLRRMIIKEINLAENGIDGWILDKSKEKPVIH